MDKGVSASPGPMSSLSGDSAPVFRWGAHPLSHCVQSWWDCNQKRMGILKSHTWVGDGGSRVTPSGGVPKDPAPGSPEISLGAVLSVARSSAFLHHFALATVSVACNQRTLAENSLGI